MKIMTFKVAVIAFLMIWIAKIVCGVIFAEIWSYLDDNYTRIEGNSFLRKVYHWLDNFSNNSTAQIIIGLVMDAIVLFILSVIF